jgi:hypothetical protein
MGRNYLADIPGNKFIHTFSHASTASNGASIVPGGQMFIAPADLKILQVARVVGANECTKGTATSSASYRSYTLYDGSSDGSGTASLAALSQTVSQAASASRAFTLAGTPTVAEGNIIYFKIEASVGGAVDDSTAASAALIQVDYELI